jgi:hypothetical protein
MARAMERLMEAVDSVGLLYMNKANVMANVDNQLGEGAISGRQVCGQKLYLMRTANP